MSRMPRVMANLAGVAITSGAVLTGNVISDSQYTMYNTPDKPTEITMSNPEMCNLADNILVILPPTGKPTSEFQARNMVDLAKDRNMLITYVKFGTENNLDELAKEINQVIDMCGSDNPSVVLAGSSLGGKIALYLASNQDINNLKAIILESTAISGDEIRGLFNNFVVRLRQIVPFFVGEGLFAKSVELGSFDRGKNPFDDEEAENNRKTIEETDLKVFNWQLYENGQPAPDMTGLNKSVLIYCIFSLDDKIADAEQSYQKLASQLPNRVSKLPIPSDEIADPYSSYHAGSWKAELYSRYAIPYDEALREILKTDLPER